MKTYLKDLTYKINGAAIEVHKELGSGLLESVCYKCMKTELTLREISFKSELKVKINFKGNELETDYRCESINRRLHSSRIKSTRQSPSNSSSTNINLYETFKETKRNIV